VARAPIATTVAPASPMVSRSGTRSVDMAAR
jgi:hypothetical protein